VVNSLNPEISITSCFSSDNSFYVYVTVSKLIPNETYELWYFFPDGQAIGGQQVNSDEHGHMITSEGAKEVLIGSYSSSPIQKGLYNLGIAQGRFTYKKAQFNDWEEQFNLKHHISFTIHHQLYFLFTFEGSNFAYFMIPRDYATWYSKREVFYSSLYDVHFFVSISEESVD